MFVSFCTSLLLFQNCQKGGLESKTNTVPMLSHRSDCLENMDTDVCVVNKNSVYDSEQLSSTNSPDYSKLLLKEVDLLFLDDSGYLQNNTFMVISYTGPQVRIQDGPLKFSYELDGGVSLSQVTSYYYSSLARQFSSRAELSLVGKGLSIVTQAPKTGWSAEDNTIYLGLDPDTQHDSALDGSILLNLIAEANIYYASLGVIYDNTENKHRECQGGENKCCVNELGCSKAITIGLSLYFSSSFFRDAPTVGESYSNKHTGMEDCGISRDLNKSADISLSEAFNACQEIGSIHTMGTVYGSIWWNVFKEISDKEPDKVEDFHVFYLEHLKRLKGNFDFPDAFNSIQRLDSESFQSEFTSYFRNEFIRRGLTIP